MTFFLLTLTHLLTLVNPFGVIPLFMTMTEGLDKNDKIKIAFKATFTAFIAMLIVGLAGKWIFSFFGVSLNGLKIVGGIIFMISGYDMLNARVSRIKDYHEEEPVKIGGEAAVSPLAIPMISGPGAMTAVMLSVEKVKDWAQLSLVVLAIAITLLICFLILSLSGTIMKLLGEGGAKVSLRVMGLILMMIAVEFFFSGVGAYVEKFMTLPTS